MFFFSSKVAICNEDDIIFSKFQSQVALQIKKRSDLSYKGSEAGWADLKRLV
jgi:hypothetical protein